MINVDWNTALYPAKDECPLQTLVDGYSYTSIFRTIAVIGDSLSAGEFEIKDTDGSALYYDMYPYAWAAFLARKNGITLHNFARDNMTAKEYIDSYADEMGFWDPEKRAQAYIIALGVNDILNYHTEVGTLADICTDDPAKNAPTFMGYYGAIVSRYKAICPDAKFFFVTIPATDFEPECPGSLAQRQALYDMASLFDNAYVIDLYRYAPQFDADFAHRYFLNGHMDPTGYLLMARMIDSYIDYIIRHNPKDFKQVGFIGTGIKY